MRRDSEAWSHKPHPHNCTNMNKRRRERDGERKRKREWMQQAGLNDSQLLSVQKGKDLKYYSNCFVSILTMTSFYNLNPGDPSTSNVKIWVYLSTLTKFTHMVHNIILKAEMNCESKIEITVFVQYSHDLCQYLVRKKVTPLYVLCDQMYIANVSICVRTYTRGSGYL